MITTELSYLGAERTHKTQYSCFVKSETLLQNHEMHFPVVIVNILEKNASYFYDRVFHARNKEDENCCQIRIPIIKHSLEIQR